MVISHYCIDRPIFAAVISIIITLAGAVAMVNLPVAQYPDITPPTITVSATYPGASAEVVANNVAAPIEQQVNGADNMLYMYSTTSSTGSMNLTIFFEIGTVPSLAQVDVQNRVNLALPQLPQAVQAQGVSVQKRSSAFMMIIAVYSPDDRFSETYVANYANLYVLDAIKRVPGANQSSIFGNPDYAMRIWLKPDRMASLGITATDVQQAVTNQNQQFAVGRIGQPPTGRPVEESFTLTTQGRLTDPAQFDNIILRAESGGAALVRLKDVGRAEYGLKDYSTSRTFNGKTASVMAVYQQPGANALEVSKAVRATLAELKKSFPEGIDYAVALDTTNFTRASIEEVVQTFFEALALVVLVVYLFLHSFRVTLIPVLAVPVSIIGTFIGMIALGFSINMLTLFGMVLAIGIVVDDAIVVIENVERNMNEHGLAPVAAAKRAMDEVGGPVIAIVLVLCAVFVPVAFLGGITGQLYKQFAITIAISVVISGIVALTLSPALAALLLKPGHGPKGGFFAWFEQRFSRLTDAYASGVALVIKRVVVALLVFAGMLFLTFSLFKKIPTSFLPPEDQGYLLGAIILPDAASLGRTAEVGRRVTDFFAGNPAIDATVVVSGYSILDSQTKNNAGVFFVGLKDFDQRKEPSLQASGVIAAASKAFASIKEAIVLPINPPSIPGLGTTGGYGVLAAGAGRHLDRAVPGHPQPVPRQAAPAARAHAHHGDLQREFAADAGGCRPGEGGDARCPGAGRVQHRPDPVRIAVCESVQQVQPPVASDSASRAGVSPQAGRSGQPLRAQQRRQDGAAQGAGDRPLRHRPRHRHPLQQLPRHQGHGGCRTGLQHGRGHRDDGSGGRRSAAGGLRLRVERSVLRRKEIGRHVVRGVRVRSHHGVPDSRGAVREVVAAGRRAARGAVRDLRRAGRDLAARPAKQHLLSDRTHHADRARRQERDPDLRVRGAEPRCRQVRRTMRRSPRHASGCVRSS